MPCVGCRREHRRRGSVMELSLGDGQIAAPSPRGGPVLFGILSNSSTQPPPSLSTIAPASNARPSPGPSPPSPSDPPCSLTVRLTHSRGATPTPPSTAGLSHARVTDQRQCTAHGNVPAPPRTSARPRRERGRVPALTISWPKMVGQSECTSCLNCSLALLREPNDELKLTASSRASPRHRGRSPGRRASLSLARPKCASSASRSGDRGARRRRRRAAPGVLFPSLLCLVTLTALT